jgi:hypothetical protein
MKFDRATNSAQRVRQVQQPRRLRPLGAPSSGTRTRRDLVVTPDIRKMWAKEGFGMTFCRSPFGLYTRGFALIWEPEGDTGGPNCDEGMQLSTGDK